MLPDGALWSVVTSGVTTRLIKASLAVQGSSFAGSGKSFTLGTTAVDSSITATASVVEKSTLSGNIASATAGLSEPFALAYQSRYDTAAALADFAGSWKATLGPGTVNWTIGASGNLSGTRTTGCTYTGQISLRTERKAVTDAAVLEDCAGAKTQFNGVAVKTADGKAITLLMTTAGDAQAVLLALQ